MGGLNVTIAILGGVLISSVKQGCGENGIAPFGLIMVGCFCRIIVMILAGFVQKATATMILSSALRHERRIRYARWLWWARFLMIVTTLQFMAATYLMIIVGKHLSQSGGFSNCIIEHASKGDQWEKNILILFILATVFVAIVQCFTGSDVLRWRSFYATEDNAWRTHYREVFDHGIREALCCMGRIKYLSVLEEDEVYSVAKLLGDLVAYRAAGTGHLELLAGLSLLQRYSQYPKLYEGCPEAPEEQIQEATVFHPFAEAAYTGLLLDIGRNPLLFPCVWLSRQGILTPWTRNRRPVLEGDNWWRGHATAFLKYVKVSSDALRRGRVNQGKCKAAYFIVVLHHAKSVVIAVRGTETPEDLITDGLCRECILSANDLDGLINNSYIHPDVRQKVISSTPHYGHSGIVEAARDLFMQIEGDAEDGDISSESTGFLSSLLGEGCECEGYDVRIVGHSLGGAIAALLGLRLHRRFPKLHVYAYGPLPCMDPIIADACSTFVTSIVYGNEFSARLSVASILRLRGAALTALSQSTADSTITTKLARRFLFVSKYEKYVADERIHPSNLNHITVPAEERNFRNGYRRSANASRAQEREFSIWQDIEDGSPDEITRSNSSEDFINQFSTHENISSDPVSEFMDSVPSSGNDVGRDIPEMYLPGLVVHIVPQEMSSRVPLWRRWRSKDKCWSYKAYVATREAFRDIIVSPSMFLDHLPWRCDYAMRKVLEIRSTQRDEGLDLV